jgi:hypothetical protein
MTGKQLWDAALDGDAAKVGTLLSTQGFTQHYIIPSIILEINVVGRVV